MQPMASRPKDDLPGRQRERAKPRPAGCDEDQSPDPHAEADTTAEREARAYFEKSTWDWPPGWDWLSFKDWCARERKSVNRAQAMLWEHYRSSAWEMEQPHEKEFAERSREFEEMMDDWLERHSASGTQVLTTATSAMSPESESSQHQQKALDPEPYWKDAVSEGLAWRIQHKRLERGIVEQARCLRGWLLRHPIRAPKTAKTVEHHIRPAFRKLEREHARPGPRPR
jgi:hypothetical protein